VRGLALAVLAALAASAALAALALAACEDRQAHVFYAHRYDPERGCLEESQAFDVLDGPEPAPCNAPRCWVTLSGEVLVTTTACAAPPDYQDRTGDPPGSTCAAALALLAEGESGARCEP